ncbi:unnamed protein product, partial [Mesorhabditis spiculigera]
MYAVLGGGVGPTTNANFQKSDDSGGGSSEDTEDETFVEREQDLPPMSPKRRNQDEVSAPRRWSGYTGEERAKMDYLAKRGYVILTGTMVHAAPGFVMVDPDGVVVAIRSSTLGFLKIHDVVISISGCTSVSTDELVKDGKIRRITYARCTETPYPPEIVEQMRRASLLSLIRTEQVCSVCLCETDGRLRGHGHLVVCGGHKTQLGNVAPDDACDDADYHKILRQEHAQPRSCRNCTAVIMEDLTGRLVPRSTKKEKKKSPPKE